MVAPPLGTSRRRAQTCPNAPLGRIGATVLGLHLLLLSALLLLPLPAQAAATLTPAWRVDVAPADKAPNAVGGLAIANDGSMLVALGRAPSVLHFVDGTTHRVLWRSRSERGYYHDPAMSADGARLVVAETTPASSAGPATHRILGLNRAGRILWERGDFGTPHLASSGEYVLLHHAGPLGGVTVLAGATGKVLWEVGAQEFGGVVAASFSPDASCVLLQGEKGAVLYTSVGGVLWRRNTAQSEVRTAATSTLGKRTAVLLSNGQVVLLNEQGDTTGVVALAGGDAKAVEWDLLSLSGDGGRVMGVGREGEGTYVVRAISTSPPAAQWSQSLEATGEAGLVGGGEHAVLALVGKAGATFRLAGAEPPPTGGTGFAGRVTAWAFSADGRWLGVLSGARVSVLGAP